MYNIQKGKLDGFSNIDRLSHRLIFTIQLLYMVLPVINRFLGDCISILSFLHIWTSYYFVLILQIFIFWLSGSQLRCLVIGKYCMIKTKPNWCYVPIVWRTWEDEDLEHFLLRCQPLETTRQVTIYAIDNEVNKIINRRMHQMSNEEKIQIILDCFKR
jgi:hypothetical protein